MKKTHLEADKDNIVEKKQWHKETPTYWKTYWCHCRILFPSSFVFVSSTFQINQISFLTHNIQYTVQFIFYLYFLYISLFDFPDLLQQIPHVWTYISIKRILILIQLMTSESMAITEQILSWCHDAMVSWLNSFILQDTEDKHTHICVQHCVYSSGGKLAAGRSGLWPPTYANVGLQAHPGGRILQMRLGSLSFPTNRFISDEVHNSC